MFAKNIIIPFVGAHAAIPTNWTRETDLDSKYPKGAPNVTAPGDTGGAITHTHTTTGNHTHTVVHHTHTFDTDQYNPPPDGAGSGGRCVKNHQHNSSITGTTSGSINNSLTYGAASNNPPYYEVIFIKAVSFVPLPVNGMILSQAVTRTNLTFHVGSAGKYLQGAGTGSNSGGTGGSYDNIHDISHTHAGGHSHGGTSSEANHNDVGGDGGTWVAQNGHTHPIVLDNNPDTLSAPDPTTTTQLATGDANVEPVYRTLNGYYNNGAVNRPLVPGDIAIWLGAIATIPVGWILCDGSGGTPDMRDKFLKLNSVEGISTTGGSNTHAHALYTHSHSVSGSHTHTGGITGPAQPGTYVGVGNDGYRAHWNHSHTAQNMQSQSTTYTSADTTPDSSDNQPPYRTALYIQFKFSPGKMVQII